MNLDQLAVDYYYASLTLAQRALIAGLTVGGAASLPINSCGNNEGYTVPLIGLKITSLSHFNIMLLILFILCGVVCFYGVHKAQSSWKLVSEKKLASRVLEVPNLLLGGHLINVLLLAFCFWVAANLSANIFNIKGWLLICSAFIVVIPYFLAFGGAIGINDKRDIK